MTGINRAQRRAAMKVERDTGGVLVERRELAQLVEAQRFLLAIVAEQGRVRVSALTLESLKQGASIKGRRDGESVTLTYEAPEEPAQEAG